MFFFIACLTTMEGGVSCTPPVAVESRAQCAVLEAAYTRLAKAGYKAWANAECVEIPSDPATVRRKF